MSCLFKTQRKWWIIKSHPWHCKTTHSMIRYHMEEDFSETNKSGCQKLSQLTETSPEAMFPVSGQVPI